MLYGVLETATVVFVDLCILLLLGMGGGGGSMLDDGSGVSICGAANAW